MPGASGTFAGRCPPPLHVIPGRGTWREANEDTLSGGNNVLESHQLPDLVCLSHLRWDFVFQRPQHLLSRFARERRVFFFEEPVYGKGLARLEVTQSKEGAWVAVPHLPEGLTLGVGGEATLLGKVKQGEAEKPLRLTVSQGWFGTKYSLLIDGKEHPIQKLK